jgi:TatD DNase family protein
MLEEDYKEKIARCFASGVSHILLVGYNLQTSIKALEVARNYDSVYAAIGIHPSELDKALPSDYLKITEMLSDPKVLAIGEVGLDYHYPDAPTKETQIAKFKYFIELANTYNKPLCIHIRDALDDAYDILKQIPLNNFGVLHCFSGNQDDVKRFSKLNLYFGFGGYITFKNAQLSRDALKVVQLSRILIETDDPYLTPVPFRGKQNEPSYVKYVLDEVVKTLEIDKEIIEEQIFKNTQQFLKIAIKK